MYDILCVYDKYNIYVKREKNSLWPDITVVPLSICLFMLACSLPHPAPPTERERAREREHKDMGVSFLYSTFHLPRPKPSSTCVCLLVWTEVFRVYNCRNLEALKFPFNIYFWLDLFASLGNMLLHTLTGDPQWENIYFIQKHVPGITIGSYSPSAPIISRALKNAYLCLLSLFSSPNPGTVMSLVPCQ